MSGFPCRLCDNVRADERLVERVAEAMFEHYHEAPFDLCTVNRRDWLAMAVVAIRTVSAPIGSEAVQS